MIAPSVILTLLAMKFNSNKTLDNHSLVQVSCLIIRTLDIGLNMC